MVVIGSLLLKWRRLTQQTSALSSIRRIDVALRHAAWSIVVAAHRPVKAGVNHPGA
jgi:hypothetical protein